MGLQISQKITGQTNKAPSVGSETIKTSVETEAMEVDGCDIQKPGQKTSNSGNIEIGKKITSSTQKIKPQAVPEKWPLETKQKIEQYLAFHANSSRPYGCVHCDKRFKFTTSRNRHMRVDHAEFKQEHKDHQESSSANKTSHQESPIVNSKQVKVNK